MAPAGREFRQNPTAVLPLCIFVNPRLIRQANQLRLEFEWQTDFHDHMLRNLA